MIRTSRRRFLKIASSASALFPVAKLFAEGKVQASPSAPAEQIAAGSQFSSAPGSVFDGVSLEGWKVGGSGNWRAQNGELVGSSAAGQTGSLVLDHGLEDFVLKFSFRAESGEFGVLLRNAPLSWSRYSHPPRNADEKTSGLYVSLSGPHAGAMSLITLNGQGDELDRKPIPPPPAEPPDSADPLRTGACSPIACVGINDPQGTTNGYAPEPPIQISPEADGWQRVEISLRGSATPWDRSEMGAELDARSQFGELALRLSGSAQSAARVKNIGIADLTQRVAGLACNVGDPRFRYLTDLFYSEGIGAGDLNRDGFNEVIAGPFYYEGPDYRVAREIFPPTTVNVGGDGEHGNYTNCFQVHVADFTGDGWPDVLMVMGLGPKPSFSAHLFLNPRGERRHWDNYNVVPVVSSEATLLADIDGDGHPELIIGQGDFIGYAKPDGADPTKPWIFHPVSKQGSWGPHGLGVGDVNGDGRLDILQASGWWEQPANATSGPWEFHPAPFGASEGAWFLRGGGDIFVYDVNGDGIPDVITSLNAHGPGLAWFEQQKDAGGNVSWKRHLIMGDPATPLAERGDWEETDKTVAFTELHALALADLDGDGSIHIITGKRWWSHGYVYDENGLANPPVLYRFKLVRKPGGAVEWTPRLIHNHSGVGTQILAKDINNDGKAEIMTTARKGTFIFMKQSYQGPMNEERR